VNALLVALLVLAAPTAPASGIAEFRLTDARLVEVSGIAAGIASPGVVYVQNDGGDSARFFALDARSGAVLAQYDVAGARNVDWEDIAVAPDANGTPSVWLADIGDNDATRQQIQIYRVDEPHVNTARHDVTVPMGPPQVWQLRYPDGAHDAESLAVSPTGMPYVFTKSYLGTTTVYAAPARPSGVQTLRPIGTLQLGLGGAATGADLSRDGTRLVVRTYVAAYFWTVSHGDVAAALRTAPNRVALPRQPQGEGICFAGARVLIDSEGVGSAVYAVPVPPIAAPTKTPGATSAPAPPRSLTATASSATGGSSGRSWLLGGGAALVALGLVVGVLRRRRRLPGYERRTRA
jgi:hypothetical protein